MTSFESFEYPEVFERPCRPSDVACIRRYFLHNSKCKPAPGRIPDPLVRSLANVFYPRVNITETDINPEYLGLNNGRIQEFYVNRDTDKLVLGIELRNFVARGNNTFFTYARRGREPITTHGSVRVAFSSVYLTVTIPQVENLRLDKSDSFVFSNDLLPIITLAPSLGESSVLQMWQQA
ncbi:fibrohexamerin-like [Choristoneura fumiferana]|uniref:fibrohexamerin-like n=1 Tax=Choristoneura fumiferana TaxID=7141 RepID=UPI003D158217